jgi:hypothetical protein
MGINEEGSSSEKLKIHTIFLLNYGCIIDTIIHTIVDMYKRAEQKSEQA